MTNVLYISKANLVRKLKDYKEAKAKLEEATKSLSEAIQAMEEQNDHG